MVEVAMLQRVTALPPSRASTPVVAIDPLADPPDPVLATAVEPLFALRAGLLPWRRVGIGCAVLCADAHDAEPHRAALEAALGPVRFVQVEPDPLAAAVSRQYGRLLALSAERRLPARDSCRSLPGRALGRAGLAAAAILGLGAILVPDAVLAGLAAVAVAATLAASALRLLALVATLRPDRRDRGAEVVPARLPVVTLLVPMYREAEIGGTILARIAALDYPRDRLDLCLVLEEDDEVTRAAVGSARIPDWAQVIVVPPGAVRTKPRALNYALNFARGSIVGLYDVEDVPAPDHLRRVAEGFARRGKRVACLQGALDYFNHDRNWMARCFTLEYASWFRVMLPGIERLGLAIPLGGTTLFVRREALEAVGAWDAHNVTEDADLGLRLARRGYRTEIIPIATQEEANARPWPWVRQRSRWLKGYAVTWAVHMRDPVRLWRDLGARRFWAFQVMFLGTVLHFALAPVLWSFWLAALGMPHPLAPLAGPGALAVLAGLSFAALVLDVAVAWVGARRSGKERLALWAPTMVAYFPLATLAIWKGLWEVVTCPFRWDKTAHGIDLPDAPAPVIRPPAPWPRRAAAAS